MHQLLPAAALCLVPACAAVAPVDEAVAAATTGDLQLNLLYIHGVENSAGSRAGAHNTLNDLKAAVAADLPSLIASYQASHPGVTIHVASASANLYTATPSGIHPSDSIDPTLMDDWEVVTDGAGCAGAFRWAQIHDSNHSHNATFFWQTRSRPADGGLIATLPPG